MEPDGEQLEIGEIYTRIAEAWASCRKSRRLWTQAAKRTG